MKGRVGPRQGRLGHRGRICWTGANPGESMGPNFLNPQLRLSVNRNQEAALGSPDFI